MCVNVYICTLTTNEAKEAIKLDKFGPNCTRVKCVDCDVGTFFLYIEYSKTLPICRILISCGTSTFQKFQSIVLGHMTLPF